MGAIRLSTASDKNRKLRRYTRKDYSQVVDFPVEIVGRDGVIRRYSFEESVRLYQRRIASANMRYGDHDVIDAEVQHCRRRIEQLRRSYFARYGWAAIKVLDSPGVLAGEFAGEVAAFLRRCLDGTSLDPEALEFTYLEEGEHRQVYFIEQRVADVDRVPTTERSTPELTGTSSDDRWTRSVGGTGEPAERYILYLFRFDGAGADGARDAFFEFLKVLQSARRGGDGIETLVAFHHSADCGLVLTGQRGTVKEVVQDADEPVGDIDLSWFERQSDQPDLLREGMSLLRQQRREDALARFVQAYEENHYRSAAYIGAAVVADQLGHFAQAETAARMGAHYFPSDPSFAYHLTLALLRQGNVTAAGEALQRADQLEAQPYQFELLRGLHALHQGDVRRGRKILVEACDGPEQADADLVGAHRWVVSQLRARSLFRMLGVGLALIGIALLLVHSIWGVLLAVVGASMFPAVHVAWRRQFLAMLHLAGGRGLRLASPSMMRNLMDRGSTPL